MPTLLQERLAAELLNPEVKTKTEALIRAGYGPNTVAKQTSRVTGSVGTVRAKEALEAKRRDSARQIRGRALSELSSRIGPEARDETILAAVKVTTDAVAAGVDDDAETLSPQDRTAARAMVLRYCRLAARVAVYRALRAERSGDAVTGP